MTTGENSLTGRELIDSYRNGKFSSAEKYQKLCQALEIFESWDEDSRVAFLQQFLELSDRLDARCSDLVNGFCRLEWHVVPIQVRRTFAELLRDIAIRHVVHAETVMRAIVSHLIPKLNLEEQHSEGVGRLRTVSALEEKEQEEIFKLAHELIDSVLSCLPASTRTLVKCCRSVFPHYTAPGAKIIGYMRHLLLLSEKHRQIAADLWEIITDNLIQLDALVSSHCDGDSGVGLNNSAHAVFALDEDTAEMSQMPDDMDTVEQKLDICLNILLCYVSRDYTTDVFFPDNAKHTGWILTAKRPPGLPLFDTLLPAFTEHVLYAHDVQSLSFVWLYLCSLSKEFEKRILTTLWKIVVAPTRSPNEWKRSHNAAAFLGGILARANYVDYMTSYSWMKEMALWCGRYVDQVVILKPNVGGIQHGTFYAVVQALLFVFCFRYKELVDNRLVDDVHIWGLGRVVHSHLEPLKYISRIVASCFANVSRHLQLVYCNHILNIDEETANPPVEPYFPFNLIRLPMSSRVLTPLLRRFTPTDDAAVIGPLDGTDSRFADSTVNMDTNEYDFMMDEDSDDPTPYSNNKDVKFLMSTSPLEAFSTMSQPPNA
ncbi:Protein C36E8.1 [Aphelenchoides avenae]|nr:Protein C36E8.1 [Aphelenchus avenae]